MCGITGWIDWKHDLTLQSSILTDMTETLTLRGPDASGTWLSRHCALGHRRLSVIDPANGAQPMTKRIGDVSYTIVYNGELYNAPELRTQLEQRGRVFATQCDTEVLLVAYMEWGASCLEKLNGIFAFAVWDGERETLFLARDRLGVKPLFYAQKDGLFAFGSEPKAILAHPAFPAAVGREGLVELFVIGPARTPGHGIYKHMAELKPGVCMTVSRSGVSTRTYWKLESHSHEHDAETTAAHIRELLLDTVRRQLVSDVPICLLLSGGLDSSALTAIAAEARKEAGYGAVDTYSIDYVDNDRHFKASVFQPNADAPWIERVSKHFGTRHHSLVFDTPELAASLADAMRARDLPGMADVDGSLFLFCREIKKDATVALSGEAADEVFGGYPWFHREESLQADTFPWSLSAGIRVNLLNDETADWLRPYDYLRDQYLQALDEVPRLVGETEEARRMREMSYLNITRFMPTLLDRKDRMSMAAGLEVRVPFCDHRLVEYVWNVPWSIKTSGDREKGILRKALKGILPDDVLTRKKSPYPKTHNPNYLAEMRSRVQAILDDSSSPVLQFVNRDHLQKLAAPNADTFNLPWFGQLMSGPQLFAYIWQMDAWLREYRVTVD